MVLKAQQQTHIFSAKSTTTNLLF